MKLTNPLTDNIRIYRSASQTTIHRPVSKTLIRILVSSPILASPYNLTIPCIYSNFAHYYWRVSPRIPGTESISSEKSNWSQFCTRVREATVATAPWLHPALHCNVVWICPVLSQLPWRQKKRFKTSPSSLLTPVFIWS